MSEPHFGGDHEVLAALLAWDADGDDGALVTVLRTWGSSPRPPGSLLAIRRRDGLQVGSVSGGCVEADLVERLVRDELADCPTTIDYGVDPAGAARFGLPCGGQLELLVERPAVAPLQAVLDAIAAGRLIERRVCLDTGEASLHGPDGEAEFRIAGATVHKCFGPHWQLLLVGAGEIADHLARIALTLGFRVSVCDPRDGFASAVPGVERLQTMPDDAVNALAERHRTAVVTLAHDPKLDDMALMEALQAGFFYVGALGSRRTSAARRERLRTLDIGDAEVARLRAPVGLDIASQTPPEIAVAIAADLIAARHGVDSAR
ncbi:MAG: XdhC family protein [Gammaproteobacteria bacterium]|nr:XdhC family protein [Gammaproteobacteria bacterium]